MAHRLSRLSCAAPCAKDTLIGEDVDGAVSGISGGERRRVSVGIGAQISLPPF